MFFDGAHQRPLPAQLAMPLRRPRIAFYSHDTMGMGHLRRNLLIATALTNGPLRAESLIISGAREAAFFTEQAGMDCVTLPALRKNGTGTYMSRNFDWSLERTARFRSQVIAAAVDNFQPDVFVVDKVPKGIANELVATLELLRKRGQTRCVLGLRDILDEPQVVTREWAQDASGDAIERYFDELWIYGDRSVYDSVAEYSFTEAVASRAKFTGYLDQSLRLEANPCSLGSDQAPTADVPTALCVVGGGQDGFELAAAFVAAGVPDGWRGIVITGPYMPSEQRHTLKALALDKPATQIIEHLVETDLYLKAAARVVAMGGYNTVMSILSYCKPAMIVPRIAPRREQWIRARRLEDGGWLTLLSPTNLQPRAIRQWLDSPVVPTPSLGCVDLGGLEQINERVAILQPNGFCHRKSSAEPILGKL